MSYHPFVNTAVTAARKAGRILLRGLEKRNQLTVENKGNHDFVSEMDKASEHEIITILNEAYPDHAILGEESGLLDMPNTDFLWIIDPLDGTTNYLNGIPHFSISIALQYKGKIEHGVIYDPVREELFTASRGQGAKLNEYRIRVGKKPSLSDALIGTGFPMIHAPHTLANYLQSFQAVASQEVAGICRQGSAALDLAYLAAGRFDGFWEIGLKLWDYAAGVLLIREAGGLISDFNGTEDYMRSGNIVSGNPKIFKQLLQTVQPALKDLILQA